jgi:hypothetical protein
VKPHLWRLFAALILIAAGLSCGLSSYETLMTARTGTITTQLTQAATMCRTPPRLPNARDYFMPRVVALLTRVAALVLMMRPAENLVWPRWSRTGVTTKSGRTYRWTRMRWSFGDRTVLLAALTR